MKVVLIPCGETEWHAAGRLLGRVELPLTGAGREQCGSWAQRLGALGLQRILHGPDELATETAAAVARQLAVPAKELAELAEVDIGLWAGLTEGQLKKRFASAHRELRESPLHVQPPGGESLATAAERVTACIRKQARKNGKQAIGVVMRPFSFALAKFALGGGTATELCEAARSATEPVVIEYECPPAQRTPRRTATEPGSKHG
ncbi:MAG: histidine phosphatase family protein [Phycisphaerae bacterium]|nr:histidine phosphatase family protein [Phycisphaerae bacterium]